jgi:hypothetical protein
MLGFDTIGNATLIAYDGIPVLATDPWVDGEAYFGSWGRSHEIPSEQRDAIRSCPFIWCSHAHPDHLSLPSLVELRKSEILLADHRGARVKNDLSNMGFRVRILPERQWVSLSKRVRILTLSDVNQDSILLVDIGGVLLIDLNDASDFGWGGFVRSVACGFRQSYLLRLFNYGGADMGNFFSEEGVRIAHRFAKEKPPLGPQIQADAVRFGARRAIPFSTFHRYQREDSIWANALAVPEGSFAAGADPKIVEVLPPFVRVDCETDQFVEIAPRSCERVVRKPEEFGDNWSDRLEKAEKSALRHYFQSKEILSEHFGFLRFKVGDEETIIDFNPKNKAGLTFEVPRQSLMAAVEYRIFDDLLIGNFMRTTLHGVASLYPNFSPYVAKYADNGLAQTKAELISYFHHYRDRNLAEYLLPRLESDSESLFRKFVPDNSMIFRPAKRMYWELKRT